MTRYQPPNDGFSQLCRYLPFDVSPGELRACAPEELWSTDFARAADTALRSCPRLDWHAYLNQYEDLRLSHVDPVAHFLAHGMYEGRKLLSSPQKEDGRPAEGSIKVSVILPYHDTPEFLEKSLRSVREQTLRDIEIIIPHRSTLTGEALQILEDAASADGRVTLIHFDKTEHRYDTRAAGIIFARGEYIMFLDSDDYFAPNACEVAYKTALKGYDIVYFGAALVSMRNEVIIDNWFNKGHDGEYSRNEAIDSVLSFNGLTHNMWNKLYSATVCKGALEHKMPGEFALAVDLYQFLKIIGRCRRLIKIPDILYYYKANKEISYDLNTNKNIQKYLTWTGIIHPIKELCINLGFDGYIERIKRFLLDFNIDSFLTIRPYAIFYEYVLLAMRDFGYEILLAALVENLERKPGFLATLLANSPALNKDPSKVSPARIAILLTGSGSPSLAAAVGALTEILPAEGFEPVILADTSLMGHEATRHRGFIHWLRPPGPGPASLATHLADLHAALRETEAGIMLKIGIDTPHLPWHVFIARLGGASTVGMSLAEAYHPSQTDTRMGTALWLRGLSCLDKLICASPYLEIYFRANGINAQCLLPPPQWSLAADDYRRMEPEGGEGCRCLMDNVSRYALLALDDPRQAADIFPILAELWRIAPGSHLLLPAKGLTREEYAFTVSEAGRLGVADYIHFAGGGMAFASVLPQCSVAISTQVVANWPDGILAAFDMGLPCVAYERVFPDYACGGAVIVVPRGDYRQAAKKIAMLLANEPLRQKMAAAGRKFAGECARECFSRRLGALLRGLDSFSAVSFPGERSLAVAARSASRSRLSACRVKGTAGVNCFAGQ